MSLNQITVGAELIAERFQPEEFVGRRWLVRAAAAFRDDPQARRLVIVGPPGSGKSAFVAYLATRWNCPRHFIRTDHVGGTAGADPRTLLVSVGAQLFEKYGHHAFPRNVLHDVEVTAAVTGQRAEVVGRFVDTLVTLPFLATQTRPVKVRVGAALGQSRVIGERIGTLIDIAQVLDPLALLHVSLLQPARAIQRALPQETVVLLVDALDEALQHTASQLLDALPRPADIDFPANLRLLMTSRPGRHLDEAGILRADCLHLEPAGDSGTGGGRSQRDACHFVLHQLRRPSLAKVTTTWSKGYRAAYASSLVEASEHNYLYLDYVFRTLKAALATGAPLPTAEAIPHGLDEIYRMFAVANIRRNVLGTIRFLASEPPAPDLIEQWRHLDAVDTVHAEGTSVTLHVQDSGKVLGKLIPLALSSGVQLVDLQVAGTDLNTWAESYLPVLGVLAVAGSPLSPAQLAAFARVDPVYVASIIAQLSPFLQREPGVDENRYRLYHTSFAEYLLDGQRNRDFPLEAATWHRRIADWYRQGQDSWQHVEWSKVDHDYPFVHLTAHLVAAGQVESLYELIDRPWLRAQLRHKGSYRFFADDAARALEAATTADFPDLARVMRLALACASARDLASAAPPEALGVLAGLGETARAYSFAALTAAPDSRARAYTAIGEALIRRGELSGAQAALQQAYLSADAIEEEPEQHQRPDLLQRIAINLVRALAFADAETCLILIRRAPYRAAATQAVSLALAQAGEPDRALRLALTIEEKDVGRATLQQLATYLARSGNATAALQVVETIEQPSTQAEVLGEIAVALAESNALGDVRRVAERALALPGFHAATALAAVAAPLVQLEQKQWVIEQAKLLEERLTPSPLTRAHLALALTIAGEAEAARDLLAMLHEPPATAMTQDAERGREALSLIRSNERDAAVEAVRACDSAWLRAVVLAGASLSAAVAGDAVQGLRLSEEAVQAANGMEVVAGRTLTLRVIGEAAQLAYGGAAANPALVDRWYEGAYDALAFPPDFILALATAAKALTVLDELNAALSLLATIPFTWARQSALSQVLLTAISGGAPVESVLLALDTVNDPVDRLAQLALIVYLWPQLEREEPATVLQADLRAAVAAVETVPPLLLNSLGSALALVAPVEELVAIVKRVGQGRNQSIALAAAADQFARMHDVKAVVDVCMAVEPGARNDVLRASLQRLAQDLVAEAALSAAEQLLAASQNPQAKRMAVPLQCGAAQLFLQGGDEAASRQQATAALLGTMLGDADRVIRTLLGIAETLHGMDLETEAFSIVTNALGLLGRVLDATEAAGTLGRAAVTLARLGDAGSVVHMVQRYLDEPQLLPSLPEAQVALLTGLSEAKAALYDRERIGELLQLATGAAQQIEKSADRSLALAQVAVEWKRHREDGEATALLEEAATLARSLPRAVDRALHVAWLVEYFIQAWDETGALQAAREAAELAKTVPGERDSAFAAQAAAGMLAEVELYDEALQLAKTIGRQSYRRETFFSLARTAIRNRRLLASATLFNAAADLRLGRGGLDAASRAETGAAALAKTNALQTQAREAEAELKAMVDESERAHSQGEQEALIENMIARLQEPPATRPVQAEPATTDSLTASRGEPDLADVTIRTTANLLRRAAEHGRKRLFETLSEMRTTTAALDNGATLYRVALTLISVESWWSEETN